MRRAGLLRGLVSAAAAALAAAACGTSGTSGTEQATAPTPATRQVLTVAAAADGYYENPQYPTIGRYPTNANIFETLVRMTPDYQLAPSLATSWTFVPPNTWRFQLRKGVKFQDGTPFTAKAVAFTIKQIGASGQGDYIGLSKKAVVKVVDDATVELTPAFPNRRLIEQLVHPSNSIVAPTSTATHPVGTGPFKFVSYERNRQITVQRWDGYWGPKPRLGQLSFRFVPDGNARVLALQSGQVQASFDVPRESAAEVDSRPGLQVARSPVGAYEALYFAIRGGPGFDLAADPLIREAVALAINRDVIVKNVWQGNAQVIQTMIPPAILGPAADTIEGFSFDPTRSKQVLDQAGWKAGDGGIRTKGGRRLELTMVVGFPNADIHGSMPEAVKAMLADVGIDLKVVTAPDENAYSDRLAKGQGDLFAEVGNQNDANPCFLPDLLFYFKGAGHGDYGYRFGPGPAFDRTIDTKCRQGVSDQEAREGAAAAMHILVDQTRTVIPVAGIFRLYGLSDKVQDFQANPSQTNQSWAGVWLAA
jgi:peptide/nickel transport system substrate-binding protein